jgi:hypothetical protein
VRRSTPTLERMDPHALAITVRYQFWEYVSVVMDYLPFELTARKQRVPVRAVSEPTERAGLGARLLMSVLAAVVFPYKLARVGECTFRFSSEGMSRKSRNGTLALSWNEVERVYRFSRAYLFAKAGGAMPVPYRCLATSDRARLEALLASVHHGLENAA